MAGTLGSSWAGCWRGWRPPLLPPTRKGKWGSGRAALEGVTVQAGVLLGQGLWERAAGAVPLGSCSPRAGSMDTPRPCPLRAVLGVGTPRTCPGMGTDAAASLNAPREAALGDLPALRMGETELEHEGCTPGCPPSPRGTGDMITPSGVSHPRRAPVAWGEGGAPCREFPSTPHRQPCHRVPGTPRPAPASSSVPGMPAVVSPNQGTARHRGVLRERGEVSPTLPPRSHALHQVREPRGSRLPCPRGVWADRWTDRQGQGAGRRC